MGGRERNVVAILLDPWIRTHLARNNLSERKYCDPVINNMLGVLPLAPTQVKQVQKIEIK